MSQTPKMTGSSRRWQEESGSALLASLLVIVLLTGVGLKAMTTSSITQNKSKNVVSDKQAFYLAEAGLNHGKMTLHQNIANWAAYAAYTTPQTFVASTSIPGIGSYVVTVKGNNGALVMTSTATGNNSATSSVSTVVTLDNGNTLNKAWIGSNLTISGSPVFSGTSGGLHLNGNLTISGSPTINGNAEASGTYTVQTGAHPTVTGFAGGGTAQQPINTVTTSTYYGTQDYYFNWNYSYSDGTYHAYIYDKNWNLLADVAPNGTWNCWTYKSYTATYNFSTGQYVWTPFTWTATCLPPNGSYYMNGEVVISGSFGTAASPWIATILAQGSVKVSSPSLVVRPPVSTDGVLLYKSQTKNLLFVSNKDVLIQGNASQSLRGIITAYEQMGVSGNPVFYGYTLVQNLATMVQPYIGSDMVTSSYISGNMQISYNGDLPTSTQGNGVPQATIY